MIVASASVKIHEDFSFVQRFQKPLKVKFLEYHNFCIIVMFKKLGGILPS